jgi:hypothetical protein
MKTREELAEYHRQYYLANKERIRAYQKGWWDRMGNEINRRRRKRRQTDPEWRESERLRVAAYAEIKRAEDPRWRRPVKDTPGRPKGASK